MKIDFLGTGSADWYSAEPCPGRRRMTSTLFDGQLLIDMMAHALERITNPDAITDVLITHSHPDHFDPAAIAKLRPVNIYVEEHWADRLSIDGVTVHPVRAGERFQAGGFEVTGMLGNHTTEGKGEHTVHYLIKKQGQTVYYATDGAWLMYKEAELIRANPLDAIVLDATVGDGHPGESRVFEHNTLPMIRIMVDTMRSTGMLKEGAPVFLTHISRTFNPSQEQLERENPYPYVVCKDGLSVEL